MKAALFLLGVGLVLVVIQTAPSSSKLWFGFKPDLLLVVVVWAGLRLPLVSGLGFACAAGILMGLLSGAPPGLFALVYSLVLVTGVNLNARVHLDNMIGRACTIFGATLATAGAILLVRWSEGPLDFGRHAAGWIFMKSFMTALVSLVLFPLVDRLWVRYARLVGVAR